MASYCKITLVGNVGQDPTIKDVNGKKVANVSIAVSAKFGGEERTDWYRIDLWERLADVTAQYVKKGSQIMVEGRLNPRPFTDTSGVQRISLDVRASDLVLLGSRADGMSGAPSGGGNYANNTGGSTMAAAEPQMSKPLPPIAAGPDDDDLPF